MRKQFFAVLLGAVVLVMPFVAKAEGSYLKFGLGQSEYKNNFSANETAASLAYGFSIDKNFGVELGYINFGNYSESDVLGSESLKRQAFYIAGVGSLPVTDAFSLFAKLGVAANKYDYKLDAIGVSESENVTKTRSMFGLGLSYNFTKQIAGTLEYQDFGKVGAYKVKASAITAGIKYDF
jgi:OOP family OmpA-OmpF porin